MATRVPSASDVFPMTHHVECAAILAPAGKSG